MSGTDLNMKSNRSNIFYIESQMNFYLSFPFPPLAKIAATLWTSHISSGECPTNSVDFCFVRDAKIYTPRSTFILATVPLATKNILGEISEKRVLASPEKI